MNNSLNGRISIKFEEIITELRETEIRVYKEIEKISTNSAKYHILKKEKPKKDSILSHVLLRTPNYERKKKLNDLENKIKNSFKKIYSDILLLHKKIIALRNDSKLIERYLIDQKTIDYELNLMDNEFQELLESFIILTIPNFEDIIFLKKLFKKNFSEIKKELTMIENILLYQYDRIEINVSKLKNIKQEELRLGDIILLKNKVDKHFFIRLVRKLLLSDIIHASIVYKIINGKAFVFQSHGYDVPLTKVDLIEQKKGEEYIVLRYKRKFTSEEKEILKKEIEGSINLKFSVLEILGAFLRRHIERTLRNLGFYGRRKKNFIDFKKKTFCSEVIAEIYSKININLGILDDPSTTSPIDILNSSQFKIIGKLSNENSEK